MERVHCYCRPPAATCSQRTRRADFGSAVRRPAVCQACCSFFMWRWLVSWGLLIFAFGMCLSLWYAACGPWYVACSMPMWHATCGVWHAHVTCGNRRASCGMWPVPLACGAWYVSCGACTRHGCAALGERHVARGARHAAYSHGIWYAVAVSGVLHVTCACGLWHVARGLWHVSFGVCAWHVTRGMWPVACDGGAAARLCERCRGDASNSQRHGRGGEGCRSIGDREGPVSNTHHTHPPNTELNITKLPES